MNAAVILRIDAAMRGNKVIYWLGRIPLIKRLVSDSLYEASEGKLALSILLWIWRVLKSFAGTFLYLYGDRGYHSLTRELVETALTMIEHVPLAANLTD